VKVEQIKKVAVIGAGIMGPGIAMDFAKAGYKTTLVARRQESLDTAQKVVHKNLLTLVKNSVMSEAEMARIEGNFAYGLSIPEAAKDADIVVECINEKMQLKGDLFKQLDEVCKPDVIIGSNTSYLNIFEVVPEARKSNTVITHWFAPAHILPLVEVVRAPEVSKETEETMLTVLRNAGKTPVLMQRYVPGHAINRLLRIIGREVFNLLDNGYITADQLDLAVKASIAPRMCTLGVVQRYDFTGLDLSAGNLRLQGYPEPPLDNAPKSLVSLVEKGDLGVKSGKGFFDYTDKPIEDTLAKRDEDLIRVIKATEFARQSTPKLAK
jgi:3-hydroxybutyryl-CoA dehydrogenase